MAWPMTTCGRRYERAICLTWAVCFATARLRLARWRCGLPSTTPASQAGILYGNNWDIPGFRWYDKATGDSIMCKLPGMVKSVQDRISAGRAGLLRGGSSYTNMFDGDARLALFTLSALGRHRVFENVRGLGFLVLFGLSPLRLLRTIGLSLWTWLVYVVKRAATWIRVRPRGSHFTFLGPLLEIFNNVIFREVTTFSVMLDIYRGMPAIYAAYTGYDEIAHHFGADSREAFRALRGIDGQIRQIDRIRQHYMRRAYDLYHPLGPWHDRLAALRKGLRADPALTHYCPHRPGGAQLMKAGARQKGCQKPGSTLSWTRSGALRPGPRLLCPPASAGYAGTAGSALAGRGAGGRVGPEPAG